MNSGLYSGLPIVGPSTLFHGPCDPELGSFLARRGGRPDAA